MYTLCVLFISDACIDNLNTTRSDFQKYFEVFHSSFNNEINKLPLKFNLYPTAIPNINSVLWGFFFLQKRVNICQSTGVKGQRFIRSVDHSVLIHSYIIHLMADYLLSRQQLICGKRIRSNLN